jgi:hypothetical protein
MEGEKVLLRGHIFRRKKTRRTLQERDKDKHQANFVACCSWRRKRPWLAYVEHSVRTEDKWLAEHVARSRGSDTSQ